MQNLGTISILRIFFPSQRFTERFDDPLLGSKTHSNPFLKTIRMPAPKLLIDGYNLLFQSSFVGRGRGPGWLENSRQRLISHIFSCLGAEQSRGTVIVFDAPKTTAAFDNCRDFVFENTIRVIFALEHPEADDFLEETIRSHPHPKTMRVISSDQRIRRCARARRAKDVPAEKFLRELELSALTLEATDPTGESSTSQGDELLDSSEVEYWLKQFRTEP